LTWTMRVDIRFWIPIFPNSTQKLTKRKNWNRGRRGGEIKPWINFHTKRRRRSLSCGANRAGFQFMAVSVSDDAGNGEDHQHDNNSTNNHPLLKERVVRLLVGQVGIMCV